MRKVGGWREGGTNRPHQAPGNVAEVLGKDPKKGDETSAGEKRVKLTYALEKPDRKKEMNQRKGCSNFNLRGKKVELLNQKINTGS